MLKYSSILTVRLHYIVPYFVVYIYHILMQRALLKL